MSHLSSALKALTEASANNSEAGMTYEDWVHVVDLCISLEPVVAVFGNGSALTDLDHIRYQATQWRDR